MALIYVFYCPGAANLFLKQPIEKSLADNQSTVKRLYLGSVITISLCLLAFATYYNIFVIKFD